MNATAQSEERKRPEGGNSLLDDLELDLGIEREDLDDDDDADGETDARLA